jgi:uncharacterized protein
MNQPVSVSQAQVAENSFFTQVYMWMAGGLFMSAFGALFVLANPPLLKAIVTNPMLLIGLVVVEIGLVIWLSAAIHKLSVGQAIGLFCAYSLLNGVTLCFILLMYTGASVISTFAITAGTFICFSVYGYATKKDLTSVGQLAFMGLIGIIIASVVNIFLRSPAMYWLITYLGIAIFLGLIAYDTQRLKEIHRRGFDSHESRSKLAIMGALRLYLDFINLFILLLRLFGNRR